jgi:protein import protein ZIM17
MFRMYSELCNSHATRTISQNTRGSSLSREPPLDATTKRALGVMSFTLTHHARAVPFARTRERLAVSVASSSSSRVARHSRSTPVVLACAPSILTFARRRDDVPIARARSVARVNVLGEGGASSSDDDDDNEKRASVQLPRTRRRVQMTFTCNKCEGRTMRLINPDVLERGTMWVQCGECEVWHQIVDNLGLIFDFTGDYMELKDKIKNAKRLQPPELDE